MKILIACEYSGIVRESFVKRGHDVISCDILPTEIPGKHYQGDVRDILYDDWDMIIAHPPCIYLANSGVRWLFEREGRWKKLDEGVKFFRLFIEHPCKKICVENSIPHKYAVERIGRKYDQIVQPWMFGHLETKAACLWLKGLSPLVETKNVKEETFKLPKKDYQRVHYLSPTEDRGKLRSKTYEGVAEAMADQWGRV